MTAVAAYLVVVVAFAALCCGHHGEEFPIPLRGAWRGLRGAAGPSRGSADAGRPVRPSGGRLWLRSARVPRPGSGVAGPRRRLSARLSRELPPDGSQSANAADGRSQPQPPRPPPAWARPDKDTP